MGLAIYCSVCTEQKTSSQDSGAYELQLNELMHSAELPELTLGHATRSRQALYIGTAYVIFCGVSMYLTLQIHWSNSDKTPEVVSCV